MDDNGVFRALDLAASGLMAQRRRLDVVSSNIANANTLRTSDGGPYRRREIVFEAELGRALEGALRLPRVGVGGVTPDPSALPRIYRPSHPYADAEGFLTVPNVSLPFEMVDLLDAMRSYEANVRTIRSFRSMVDAAFGIGRL